VNDRELKRLQRLLKAEKIKAPAHD